MPSPWVQWPPSGNDSTNVYLSGKNAYLPPTTGNNMDSCCDNPTNQSRAWIEVQSLTHVICIKCEKEWIEWTRIPIFLTTAVWWCINSISVRRRRMTLRRMDVSDADTHIVGAGDEMPNLYPCQWVVRYNRICCTMVVRMSWINYQGIAWISSVEHTRLHL
jgi:hypothetical protein